MQIEQLEWKNSCEHQCELISRFFTTSVYGVMEMIEAVIEAILRNNGAIVWEISSVAPSLLQLSRLRHG